MKNCIIYLIVFSIGICACSKKQSESNSYKDKLAKYLQVDTDSLVENYVFYDSIELLSINLRGYKFYNKCCDSLSWNKGYIIIDNSTDNSYVACNKIIPVECKDTELINHAHTKGLAYYKTHLRELSDIGLSCGFLIFKEFVPIESQNVEAFLNNTSISNRAKLDNALLDSIFRFFYFDSSLPNKVSRVDNAPALAKILNYLKSNWFELNYQSEYMKKINTKLIEDYFSFIQVNIDNPNFYVYDIGNYPVLIEVGISNNRLQDASEYKISRYTMFLIDSTFVENSSSVVPD